MRSSRPQSNYFRFRLSPDVLISLGARVKMPGEAMVGEAVELIARHHPGDEMTPYERLLGDAIRGDASLFTSEDCVEAAWRVVDPILGNATPVAEYEPNTWGPPEAERIVAGDGGWHNPGTEERDRMSASDEVVFLFDCDNTLLDNDRVQEDLRAHLAREFGAENRDRYWAIFETLARRAGLRGLPGCTAALSARAIRATRGCC